MGSWGKVLDAHASDDALAQQFGQFQSWISAIPGIDEATALASAIQQVDTGKYDLIVFDTAPTGHTLKLLQLPSILEAGLEKLTSWQATVWGYWDMFRSLGAGAGAPDLAGAKGRIAEKLRQYQESINRVAAMIKDQRRTRFVVVCIAEYLSINLRR